MSPLGKKIVVFTMLWVFLVMIVMQAYDNVTGRGAPARPVAGTPTVEATAGPDEAVTRLAELQSCLAADPQNLQCVVELADLYYAAQLWPQAQVNYELAINLDPHNVRLLLRLAGTYIYQQKFPEATTTLQQTATLQPDSPEIHLLLGLALSKLEPPRTDEAIAEWQRVIELAPGSDWAEQAAIYINEAPR